MIKFEFEKLLDECISALGDGESLEEILNRFPEQKEALLPLLLAAEKCQGFSNPIPSETAFHAGRKRLLDETAVLSGQEHFLKNGTKAIFSRYAQQLKYFIGNLLFGKEIVEMRLATRIAVYSLITVLVAGFFTVNASASSLPGDNLYGLKLGWERARLALTLNDDARQELEQEFEEERLNEIDDLLQEGRQAEFEFHGLIEGKTLSTWVISGFLIEIDPDTELSGSLEIGDWVKVEGLTRGDGSLLAVEIEGDEVADDVADDTDDDLDDDMSDDTDDDMSDDTEDDMSDEMEDDTEDDTEDDSEDDMEDDVEDDTEDDSEDDMEDDSEHDS